MDSNNMYASFIRNRPRIIPNPAALASVWDELTANQGGYADAATQAYLSRAGSFDPTNAINTYARGAWDQASTGMRDELRRLKGSAVGGGRLDTGFFDEDQGEVYKNTVSDFNNRIAQTAVTGAGMQLQNNAGLANFASDRTNMFADLLASRREQVENDARAAAAAKKKKKKGIGGLIGKVIGGVGGFLVGGPTGAAAGYKYGGDIGSGIASW